jgi:predicted homoserine dehydrogenase-like protein
MLIDRALQARHEEGKPLRVALVGAGYSGRNIAYQIIKSVPGIRLVTIVNRSLEKAREAYSAAGVGLIETAETSAAVERAIASNRVVISEDATAVCDAEGIDAVIEATGTVEYAAGIVLRCIRGGKHVVLMNVELDATLGPILKVHADKAGVVYSNSDGDEPGAAMNLVRFVRAIGLDPVVAGNLKGLYDRYRTPETQREFAHRVGQQPARIASFADGTKLSMELGVLANATGFGVAKRGMYGATLRHVDESGGFFAEKVADRGIVDFLVGAAPHTGVFVLGRSTDSIKAAYLEYLKMGRGPLYVFYRPFHLPQLEIPLTVARAVLFGEATVAPLGRPVCDTVAAAKRDLRAGETLDGFGGFSCYGLLDNYEAARKENALPMGVSEGCRLTRNVGRDELVRYEDVVLPEGRLVDRLRAEQHALFFN